MYPALTTQHRFFSQSQLINTMSATSNKRMVTLADLDTGLIAGTIRVQTLSRSARTKVVADAGAPAPVATFALVDAQTGKQVQLALGHGLNDPALNPCVLHAGPPSGNPASKVHFCLVEVPESDQGHLRSVNKLITEAALTLNIVTNASQLKLPFSLPELNGAAGGGTAAGKPPGQYADVYGVWTRWFVDCKTSVAAVEVTRDPPVATPVDAGSESVPAAADVASAPTAPHVPKQYPAYPPERILRDMHSAQITDVMPFELYKDQMCMNLITRCVFVDSTEANHDEVFERPVTSGRVSKVAVPLTVENADGYIVVNTDEPGAMPTWVPASEYDSVGPCRKPLTIDEMATKLEAGLIELEIKTTPAAKATEKHPAGSQRKFLNVKNPTTGNTTGVMTVLGSFDTSNIDRPYVAIGAHTFPTSLDPSSKSALVSYPDKKDLATWRRINACLYNQVIDKVVMRPGSKKRPSIESIQNSYHFPAIDPAVEDPANPRDIVYDEATDTWMRTDADGKTHKQNAVTYVKMRDEAPKGIEELRTRVFEVNRPDQPFAVTELNCEAIERGRHPLFVTEWSELADMKGQRIILHTKFVLLQSEHTEPITYSLEEIPGEVRA